jgi:hypothetical protein
MYMVLIAGCLGCCLLTGNHARMRHEGSRKSQRTIPAVEGPRERAADCRISSMNRLAMPI